MRKKPIWLAISLLGLALGSCDPALPSSSSSFPGSSSETSKVETSSSDSEPVSVVSNELISESDGVRTYKIVFSDGTETVYSVKDGADGAKGPDGTYIVEVKKTGSEGNVDTYTIYLTDGSTFTFTVTNGTAAEPSDKVTVSFDANGGKLETTTIEVEKGSTTELPIPTRNGYTFLGWYTDKRIDSTIYSNVTPISGDVALIARWTPVGGDWTMYQVYYVSEMTSMFKNSFLSDEQISQYQDDFDVFVSRVLFASNETEGWSIKEEFGGWLAELPVTEEGIELALSLYGSDLQLFETYPDLLSPYQERFDATLAKVHVSKTVGQLDYALDCLNAVISFAFSLVREHDVLENGRAFYETVKEAFDSYLLGSSADLPLNFTSATEVFELIYWQVVDGNFQTEEILNTLQEEFNQSNNKLQSAIHGLANYLCNYIEYYQVPELPGIADIIQPFIDRYDSPQFESIDELQAFVNGLTADFSAVLAEVKAYFSLIKTVTIWSPYPFAYEYGFGNYAIIAPGETVDAAEYANSLPGYSPVALYTDPELTELYNEGSWILDESAPAELYIGFELTDEELAYDCVKDFGYNYFPMLDSIDSTVENYRGQGVDAAYNGLFQATIENIDTVQSYFQGEYDYWIEQSQYYPEIDATAELQALADSISELNAYTEIEAPDIAAFKELYDTLIFNVSDLSYLFFEPSGPEDDLLVQKEEGIKYFEENWGNSVNGYGCDLSGRFDSLHDVILLCYQEAGDFWQLSQLEMITNEITALIGDNATSYVYTFESFIDLFRNMVSSMMDRTGIDFDSLNQMTENLQSLRDSGSFTPEEMLSAFYEASEALFTISEDNAVSIEASVIPVFPSESALLFSMASSLTSLPASGDFSAMSEYSMPGFEISGIYADFELTQLISDDSTYELGDIPYYSGLYLTYELVDWEAAAPYLKQYFEGLFEYSLDSFLENGIITEDELAAVRSALDSIDSEESCLAAIDAVDSFIRLAIGRQYEVQIRSLVKGAETQFGYSADYSELDGYLSRLTGASSYEDFSEGLFNLFYWLFSAYPNLEL